MPDMLSQPLHDWQNFYLLVGTAAATLVGLMFVAISLGVRSITQQHIPALRVFVSPTLIQPTFRTSGRRFLRIIELPRDADRRVEGSRASAGPAVVVGGNSGCTTWSTRSPAKTV